MIPSPLRHAMRIATTSSYYPYKLGAVVAVKKHVLGRGCNSIRRHFYSTEYHYSHSCHAEAAAILNTPRHLLKGASLYVARANKSGLPRLARPCECCLALAHMVGIKKIIYTTHEGYDETVLRYN